MSIGSFFYAHHLRPLPSKPEQDYEKRLILVSGLKGGIDIITLKENGMPSHFHPAKDEIFYFVHVEAEAIMTIGEEEQTIRTGLFGSCPRGVVHDISIPIPSRMISPIVYLAINYTDGDLPTIWIEEKTQENYQFGIYPISVREAQGLALEPMSYVQRWQKKDKPSDPEDYLKRSLETKSEVKILVFYDRGKIVGSAFVGAAEGYDIPKTRAIVQHGGGNPDKISDEDININYQSWEDIDPEKNPYAFTQENLPLVWQSFKAATKLAFPFAKAVVVRSRHKEIWSYVYTSPWEVVCEANLYNPPFEWTAPDGKKFVGYDEKFSHYGILRLPLV